MRLAQFIKSKTREIISEWEEFARLNLSAASKMDLKQRRDHVEAMLRVIELDLETSQTRREQTSKAKGLDDASVASETPATSHGTDRAATGFSPVDVIAEFRALRASVLRLWRDAQTEFNRDQLDDVTRFNEAIDQLLVESMTRFASDVEHSKDLFLGILSHDLRNPLGAIMMSATVMMTQEGPDWPHAKTASRIITAGTRMDRLIGDLVDFTRSRLGTGIPVAPTDVDLELTCRHVVDEITAFHPQSVVNFEARGDLHGRWDGSRIAQALSNLCGNALQHGARAPIDVTLFGEADHVVLSVHNEGEPIPKNRMRDIFTPFIRLDRGGAQATDGRSIGLGLFIAEAIVTAHHGTIGIESGQSGTTFTVRLPRNAADDAPQLRCRSGS